MDKLLIRKDIYDELLEKGYGNKDLSKLTKKQITDKNGHRRTVYVRNGEDPSAQKQPKSQEELTSEKKAHYEEMLEKVKAGSDENALFVRGKGMLNKKDAIAHLSEKLGKKPVNSAYVGHLESDYPPNTDITKEDEERFGKQALSGLSGKRTSSVKSSDELQKEQDKIRNEYREYFATDEYEEGSEKTKKFLEQLDAYDKQIEDAKVRETGMTRYVREGYEAMQNVDAKLLPKLKTELEQKVQYEQETLERYNKMKPKDKTQKDSLEVNKWSAQRNIDENLGRLKAINERMKNS
jgi:hypothetical protein